MTTDAAAMISATDLRGLTLGSFEHRIAVRQASIVEGAAKAIGVDPDDVTVLSTYEDAAIVCAPKTGVWRVKLEASDKGEFFVVGATHEPGVPVYSEDTVFDFVEDQTELAVEAYLRGDASGALARIEQLIHVLPAKRPDEVRAVSTLEWALTASKGWKRLYENRKEKINRFLVEALDELARRTLKVKYKKLYDGSLEESDFGSYEKLVEQDLADVSARYRALIDQTRAAIDSARDGVERRRATSPEVVDLFESFAQDLMKDLEEVAKLGDRTCARVSTIAGRAKVRDILAENISQYEVASRFVVEASSRLSKTV